MMYKHAAEPQHQGPYEIAIVASQAFTTVEVAVNGPVPLTVTFAGGTYTNGDTIEITLLQLGTAYIGTELRKIKKVN